MTRIRRLAAALAFVGSLPCAGFALAEDEEPPQEGEEQPAPPEEAPPAEGADDASLVKRFEKLGLEWKIPPPPAEGDKPRWEWGDLHPDVEKGDQGDVGTAAFGTPGTTLMSLEVSIQPAKPGAVVERFIDNQENLDNLSQNFDGTPTPQLERDVPVGNLRGGAIVATGKHKATGKPLQIRWYIVILKGVVYQVQLVAHENAQRDESQGGNKKDLLAALAGLKWLEAGTEGVRGPVEANLPYRSHTEPRGKDGGKETKVERGTLLLKKPPLFAEIGTPEMGRSSGWLYAAEARKPKAYAFVGFARWPLKKEFSDPEPPRMEVVIDELEGEWKNAAPDAVTRKSEKAPNRKPTTFKGGKGFEYLFKGTVHGVPYEDQGWLIEEAGALWWVRVQYGGENARSALEPEVKKILGSAKFEKK